MIKRIKKKIAKGLEITVISRELINTGTIVRVTYSDDFTDFCFYSKGGEAKKLKKLDSFLYLKEKDLERRNKLMASMSKLPRCDFNFKIVTEEESKPSVRLVSNSEFLAKLFFL